MMWLCDPLSGATTNNESPRSLLPVLLTSEQKLQGPSAQADGNPFQCHISCGGMKIWASFWVFVCWLFADDGSHPQLSPASQCWEPRELGRRVEQMQVHRLSLAAKDFTQQTEGTYFCVADLCHMLAAEGLCGWSKAKTKKKEVFCIYFHHHKLDLDKNFYE